MCKTAIPNVLAFCLFNTCWAADVTMRPPSNPREILAKQDCSVASVQAVFASAFIDCRIVDEEVLLIRDQGMKICLKVDSERHLMSYFRIFPMCESVADVEKLQFINRLNRDLIGVRFYMPRPNALVCDYQLAFEKSIRTCQIMTSYRLFRHVVQGAVATQDPDDITGDDDRVDQGSDRATQPSRANTRGILTQARVPSADAV